MRDRFLFTGTDWEILDGQNWAVIGPNGAGKTSLVGALTGEVPVVAGSLTKAAALKGEGHIGCLSFERHRDLIAAEEDRDEARYFSGRFSNGLTTRKLLAEPCRLGRVDVQELDGLVDRLGLRNSLHRLVRTLSAGEIRMVMIARELLKQPRMLILDEPFGGLDETAKRRLVAVIDELMHQGVQLILVTHHLEEIGPHFTHVLAVKNGRVFFQGPRSQGLESERVRQLYASPAGEPATDQPGDPPVKEPAPRAADDVFIKMKNVCIRYDDHLVLENLNWTVRRNENWRIIGPNGAGKTTLLRLVAAEHPQAYANEIYLFGRRRGSGESIWDIKNRIGMISAEFHIRYRKPIPAFDVVLSGFFDSVGLYRHATSEQRDAAGRWMQTLQIADKAERLFHTLSQGEQRMVLLTRAMIKSPRLLILDEPCQGLDPPSRDRLLGLIDRIGCRPDTQLLYVTHHRAEALSCITHELRFVRAERDRFRVIQQDMGQQKRSAV